MQKTVIRPMVCTKIDTVCLSEEEDEILRIFERRDVREIYGPKEREDGIQACRLLSNKRAEEKLE